MAMDLFPIEGSIHMAIDAAGMRGENKIKKRYKIGEDHFVSVFIHNHDGSPLSLQQQINPGDVKIGTRFIDKNKKEYFGMDVDRSNNLHYHLARGDQTIKQHISISGSFTLAQWTSDIFENVKKVIEWKFPEVQIIESDGITGTS